MQAKAVGRGVLSSSLVQQLEALAAHSGPTALLLRNLPIDIPLPSTPGNWQARVPLLADFITAMIGGVLGDLFAWTTIQDGILLPYVLPMDGHEHEQTGHGSDAELVLHVEDAFHDARSDVVSLLCLRNDDNVATTVASITDVRLSEGDLRVLLSTRLHVDPDPEHLRGTAGAPDRFDGFPALFPIEGGLGLRIDPYFTRSLPAGSTAREAFERLCTKLNSVAFDICLEAGDMLIIDNYRCVHGRRAFSRRSDGRDRWLLKATTCTANGTRRVDGLAVDPFPIAPVTK